MNGALVKYYAMGQYVGLTAHSELPAQGQALHKFRSFRETYLKKSIFFFSLEETHLETTCYVKFGNS